MLFVVSYSCFQIRTGKYAGRWKAVAQLRDESGVASKPKQIQRETEDLARAAMDAWLAGRARLLPSVGMTVEALCDAYIARCEARKRAPKTIADYKKLQKGYITKTIGHVQIKTLTPAHVEAMLEGLPDKTAVNVRAFLRAAINKIARKADPKLPNVAALAEPPSYRPESGIQLTPENFAAVIEKEADPMRRALWLTLAESGLRPEEVRHLTWFEIHQREDGWWIQLQDSKTEAGKKPVPISKVLQFALQQIPRSSVRVFPGRKDVLNDRTVRNWWTEAQETAEVPVTNLYQLRHFFGTNMARKVKDSTLARLMRHTDARTSKRYYVHPFDSELREAIDG